MRRSIFLCCWCALACGREVPVASAPEVVATATVTAVAPAEPVTAQVKPAAPAALEALGIAACDGHVAAYRRCIDGLPAAERPPHEQALAGRRLAWAQAKGDPALAEELPRACAAATVAAKVALPQCKGW
jgi:hypothetical protein